MELELLKIADLVPAQRNTRTHSQKQLAELARSFKKFEQLRPLVIDENNVVWCGNGFYEALKSIGAETVYCLRKVGMSEEDKYKMMLADNKTFELGTTNAQAMDEVLATFKDFDIPGFEAETLEQIYGDLDEAAEAMSSYGVIDDETVSSLANVEERRSNAEEHHVALEKPAVATVEHKAEDETLPTDIKAANGMLNVPKDKDTRPFIVCPRCGEKIWV